MAFLEIMTLNYRNIHYVNTCFYVKLQNPVGGWNLAKKCFHRDYSQKFSSPSQHKPLKTAKLIIIPISIGNYHWVPAVHKQEGKSESFYYADNLYDVRVENKVKRLYQTQQMK